MQAKHVIGLFFAFLMVASIFGVAIEYYTNQTTTNKLTYNGITFTPATDGLKATVNGKDYTFLFYPGDIEYLNVSSEAKTLLAKPVITVTYDPNSNLKEGFAEAQFYLEQQLLDQKTIEIALTDNTGSSAVEKSCANATAESPVIEFQESNVSGITTQNNCIIVGALDGYDAGRQSERLVYQVLGVMQ